ncbi:MAG: hypothetical protein AAFQ58_14405 [Pseudomonadota bacterium]
MKPLRSLACCLAVIAGPAYPNSGVEDFAAIWGNFLSFCGNVLTNPADASINAQPITGFSEFLVRFNPDHTDTYVTHVDTTQERSLTVHLTRKQLGFDMFCEPSDYELAFENPPATAAQIRAMFENGGMMVTGGSFQVAPQSTYWFTSELDELQEHSLVVEGAFPSQDTAVRVNISTEGVTLELYTTLSAEEKQDGN